MVLQSESPLCATSPHPRQCLVLPNLLIGGHSDFNCVTVIFNYVTVILTFISLTPNQSEHFFVFPGNVDFLFHAGPVHIFRLTFLLSYLSPF